MIKTNDLIPFDYHGQAVRSLLIDGEPWFITADILKVLDLNRSSVALLDEEDRGVHTMDTLGGAQEMSIVSEPGLYGLTLGSKKPEAKPFKRWVTHDVIPTVRKTGTYSMKPMTPIQMLAEQAKAMAELEQRTNMAIESANNAQKQISGAVEALAAPTPVNLQTETGNKIRRVCKENGLSYLDAFGKLYEELENQAHVDLEARVRNLKSRMKKSGHTSKECNSISKLHVIANDPVLKLAFDGIVRRFAAKYARKENKS